MDSKWRVIHKGEGTYSVSSNNSFSVCSIFSENGTKRDTAETGHYRISPGRLLVLAAGTRNAPDYVKVLLILDFVCCGAGILVSLRWRRKAIVAVSVFSILCGSMIQLYKTTDLRVTRAFAEKLYNEDTFQAVSWALSNAEVPCRIEVRGEDSYNKANLNKVWVQGQNLTTGYSSVSNSFYQNFRKKIGLSKSTRNFLMMDAVDNPLFLRFMGVRYLVGNVWMKEYQEEKNIGGTKVYENQNVAPMFYLTTQTITEHTFSGMEWCDRQIALLESAVAGNRETVKTSQTLAVQAGMENIQSERGSAVWNGSKICVNASKSSSTHLFWHRRFRKMVICF
ncbi:MAG: YfhO family protein [Muricomes sp.]